MADQKLASARSLKLATTTRPDIWLHLFDDHDEAVAAIKLDIETALEFMESLGAELEKAMDILQARQEDGGQVGHA